MAETTTIQISRAARDHLKALAIERGETLGEVVNALVEREPTGAQITERLQRDRDVARRNLGAAVSDEEFEQADVLSAIRKIAAAKMQARPVAGE